MPNVARAELEISMNWAERYPDFMAKKDLTNQLG